MSFSEQSRYLRSPSALRVAGRRTQYARYRRIDAEHVVLRSPQQERSSPATLSRSAWRAFLRFASKAFMSASDILFALLCWVTAHFLAGCAEYAQAMWVVPETADNATDLAEPNEGAFALTADVKAPERPETKI